MKIRELFFPPRCVNCREIINLFPKKPYRPGDNALCPKCRASYEAHKLCKCKTCGMEMTDCRCMPISVVKSGCEALLKLASYKPAKNVVSSIIFVLKRRALERCENFVAYQLSDLIESHIYREAFSECVLTFLPRNKKSSKEYGYDQSKVLAQKVSDITGIPVVTLFKRSAGALEQKGLNSEKRKENAENTIFLCCQDPGIKEKTVILLDDIVTTGQTMARGVRLLLEKEAKSVIGVCVASVDKTKTR